MKKSIFKSMWLVLCLILFIGYFIAADICGNDTTMTMDYDPGNIRVAPILFTASLLCFGMWLVLSLIIKDDETETEEEH